jgi:hypothetical protein
VAEGRYALLVATNKYSDEALRALSAPLNDAADLANVLKDPSIGRFEVTIIRNRKRDGVEQAIEQFFCRRQPDDMLLFYFSGHGIKDDRGNLYLATSNTDRELLRSTAISDAFLKEVMRDSRARLQVLVIDCCFGGAFSKQMLGKSDSTVDVNDHLQGQGRVIVTASTAMEFAFEDDASDIKQRRSVFTRTIVEGLKTGEADTDGDRRVSVQNLYDYAYRRITAPGSRQTPTITSLGQEGTIYLADVPESIVRHSGPQPLTPTTGVARRLDMRPFVRIWDQGMEGSNPAVAATTALETAMALSGRAARLSPRYIYQKAKKIQGVDQDADSGIQMEVLAQVLEDFGTVLERAWPYEQGRWQLPRGKTWEQLDKSAQAHRARLYPVTTIADIKNQLGSGRPILASFAVYQSTWLVGDSARPGWIAPPQKGDEVMGALATTIVDFDDDAGTLAFAHTWGQRWGDAGFGTMSIEAAKEMFLSDSMWAVEPRGAFQWDTRDFVVVAPQSRGALDAEGPADKVRPRPSPRARAAAEAPADKVRPRSSPRARAAVDVPDPLPRRAIYDAKQELGDWSGEKLPTTALARGEGDEPTGDPAVDRTYDALGAVYQFFLEVYGRRSWDGKGAALEAVVHYGLEFLNGFWDGKRVVLGDGDGRLFTGFYHLDVIAKECTNAILGVETDLGYAGEAGALSQSLGCVFASLVKQHAADETASKADWLIGTELLGPEVKGHALFSLIEPGTAYDDATFGKDPQVGHMKDYVKTSADNGGVHINCGIPNRAFVLAAKSLKGRAWERAGKVWYSALTGSSQGGRLGAKTTFAEFAQATIAAATDLYPNSTVDQCIRKAWIAVGVEPRRRGSSGSAGRHGVSAPKNRSSKSRKARERTAK